MSLPLPRLLCLFAAVLGSFPAPGPIADVTIDLSVNRAELRWSCDPTTSGSFGWCWHTRLRSRWKC